MTGNRTRPMRTVVAASVVLAGLSACTGNDGAPREDRGAASSVPSDSVPSDAVPSEAVPSDAVSSDAVSSEAVSSEAVSSDAVPEEQPLATDPPRPDSVEVVVSLAEWDEASAGVLVGGYVSPVVEEGGTCTVELERAGRVVRTEEPGMADATTTVCGGLTVDGAELEPGTWTLVLRYRSPSVTGRSAPREVEVPA